MVSRQVVDSEVQFGAVRALLARRPGCTEGDPGVVHQDVQLLVIGEYLVRQPVDLAQVREVGQQHLCLAAGRADQSLDLGGAGGVAAVQQEQGVRCGQPQGHFAAESVGGAGD